MSDVKIYLEPNFSGQFEEVVKGKHIDSSISIGAIEDIQSIRIPDGLEVLLIKKNIGSKNRLLKRLKISIEDIRSRNRLYDIFISTDILRVKKVNKQSKILNYETEITDNADIDIDDTITEGEKVCVVVDMNEGTKNVTEILAGSGSNTNFLGNVLKYNAMSQAIMETRGGSRQPIVLTLSEGLNLNGDPSIEVITPSLENVTRAVNELISRIQDTPRVKSAISAETLDQGESIAMRLDAEWNGVITKAAMDLDISLNKAYKKLEVKYVERYFDIYCNELSVSPNNVFSPPPQNSWQEDVYISKTTYGRMLYLISEITDEQTNITIDAEATTSQAEIESRLEIAMQQLNMSFQVIKYGFEVGNNNPTVSSDIGIDPVSLINQLQESEGYTPQQSVEPIIIQFNFLSGGVANLSTALNYPIFECGALNGSIQIKNITAIKTGGGADKLRLIGWAKLRCYLVPKKDFKNDNSIYVDDEPVSDKFIDIDRDNDLRVKKDSTSIGDLVILDIEDLYKYDLNLSTIKLEHKLKDRDDRNERRDDLFTFTEKTILLSDIFEQLINPNTVFTHIFHGSCGNNMKMDLTITISN